ncbi:MAG: ABC transporter permease [bacterium]
MFKNYLKIAIRQLLRYKAYSFLKIIGLAIGMACCLLILLYVQDELSYDRHHEKADRIYRLAIELHSANEAVKRFATTAPPMASALLNNYPEIIHAVRFQDDTPLISFGEKHFYENRFFWVDATVFEVFSFPLIAGDPKTALLEPRSVVLTEEMARKYFGNENPMNRMITLDDTLDLKVTGVLKNLPHHSHLEFDFLASLATRQELFPNGLQLWWNFAYYTYLLVPEQVFPAGLEKRISRLTAQYVGEDEKNSGIQVAFCLQPLTDIHLHSALIFSTIGCS